MLWFKKKTAVKQDTFSFEWLPTELKMRLINNGFKPEDELEVEIYPDNVLNGWHFSIIFNKECVGSSIICRPENENRYVPYPTMEEAEREALRCANEFKEYYKTLHERFSNRKTIKVEI